MSGVVERVLDHSRPFVFSCPEPILADAVTAVENATLVGEPGSSD